MYGVIMTICILPCVQAIIRTVRAIQEDDRQTLLLTLPDMEHSITKMSAALQLMYGQ